MQPETLSPKSKDKGAKVRARLNSAEVEALAKLWENKKRKFPTIVDNPKQIQTWVKGVVKQDKWKFELKPLVESRLNLLTGLQSKNKTPRKSRAKKKKTDKEIEEIAKKKKDAEQRKSLKDWKKNQKEAKPKMGR